MSEQPENDGPRSETLPDRPKSVEKPEAGTRLSAAEMHDNVLGPAEDEMHRSASSVLWSSLAAGLTIGFSFLAGAYVQTLVAPSLADAAAGVVYPLGFIFVVCARSELFTENTLEPVIPLLHRRDAESLMSMFRLWGLLIVGNLVGALVFAWFICKTPILANAELHSQLLTLAQRSTSDGFGLTLLRAIMAGWLIALLTWLLASTHDSMAHLMFIWLTTAPIALFGFRHSIVGSVEALYRVAAGDASIGSMIGTFVIPAVIGNAIGGVVLVALLNYGQVRHERAQSGSAAPATG